MKNIAKLLLVFTILFFSIQPTYAKIYGVKALSDFDTSNPSKTFYFETLEEVDVDGISFMANTVFKAKPYKIKDPQRLKRNAVLVMKIVSYKYDNKTYPIKDLYVKYTTKFKAKTSLFSLKIELTFIWPKQKPSKLNFSIET